MTKTQNTTSIFNVLAVMFSRFAAPALVTATSNSDLRNKNNGVGFVLMVSLQRKAS